MFTCLEGNTPESIQFTSINRIKKVMKSYLVSPNGYWYTSDYFDESLDCTLVSNAQKAGASMAYKYRSSHEIYKMKN